MNRIYRVVFNKARGCLQVASEHAKSAVRGAGTSLVKTAAPDSTGYIPRLTVLQSALRREVLPLLVVGLGLMAPALASAGTIATISSNTSVVSPASATSALLVNPSISVGTLSNSGLLTSGNIAIDNQGTIGSLINTNTGTIRSYYSGIYNDSGSIGVLTNNGLISSTLGYGIDNYGAISTLTNTGTIRSDYTGIYNDSGSIGALTNSGLISSTLGYGIHNYGAIGTLTNTGTIRSDYNGIYNNGTIGTLTNSGLIDSTHDYGIDNTSAIGTLTNTGTIRSYYSGIYNDGTIGTLTNSGLIDSTHDYGIENYSAIGTLTNTGTIRSYYSGIYNDGTIGVLTNSGLIDSTGDYGVENYGSIGALTNSGTITSAYSGIYNDYGSIGVLTNSGTISSSGYGAGIDNYGTIGTLTNNGAISGGYYGGIYNDSTIGVLTNSGAISGRYYGGIYNDDIIGTLTNSGTISGGYYGGIYNGRSIGTLINSGAITSSYSGIDNYGTIGALTNTGTISGINYGLYDTGTIGALTNSGAISGGTGVYLNGPATTLVNAGTIIGTNGTAILIGSNAQNLIFTTGSDIQGTIDAGTTASTFTLEGAPVFTSAAPIYAPASTLTVAPTADAQATGNWTISSVTNDGTLSVGALNLTGSYTQATSGTLEVSGTPTGFGVLQVNGAANIAGDLLVNEGTGQYTVGDTYTIVNATGGVTGTFAQTKTLGNYFAAQTSYNADTVSLKVSALPAAYETGSAVVNNAYASNQAIRTGTDATLDGSEGILGRDGAMHFTAAHAGAWVKGVGATGQVSGATIRNYGAVMGYGDQVDHHLVVGGAFSGIHTQTDTASQQVNANLFSVYGYGIDTMGHLRVSASVGGGRIGMNETRTMAPLPVTAKGNTHGWLLAVGAQAQYLVPMGHAFLVPYARMNYQHTKTSAFAETGAGALNMSYQGEQTNLGLFTGGVRGGYNLHTSGVTFTPWVELGATGYVGNRNVTVLQTIGVQTGSSLAHIAPADTFDAGAGVTMGDNGPWTAKLAYAGQYNGGTHLNTFYLLADYKW